MVFLNKSASDLCDMSIHRGRVLKEAVYKYRSETGKSLTEIAKLAGYDQSVPYRHFDQDDLAYHIIRKYGRAMQHDFRVEFPEMEEEMTMVNEPEGPAYGQTNSTLADCLKEKDYWQKKYITILEQYNALLLDKVKGV